MLLRLSSRGAIGNEGDYLVTFSSDHLVTFSEPLHCLASALLDDALGVSFSRT